MATLKELKIRIGSVASSEKITGAMKMISSAKVHKEQQSLKRLMPFKGQIKSIMGHILSTGENFNSPLIEVRDVKRVGVVVYGSDDGLCGAYNINIFKGLLQEIDRLRNEYGDQVSIVLYPVGSKMGKAAGHLEGKGIEVKRVEGVDSKMKGEKVTEFTKGLRDNFLKGELDLVETLYMSFRSMSRQMLTVEQLFPVTEKMLAGDVEADDNQLYIFEPDANSIFNEVLPMFVMSTSYVNKASPPSFSTFSVEREINNSEQTSHKEPIDKAKWAVLKNISHQWGRV